MKFFDTYREIKTNAVIGGVLIILALILLLFSGKPEKKPEKQPQKPVSATVETTTPTEPEMKKQKKNVKKNVSKKINLKADYPFLIRINRAENFVTVYGIDFDGNYTVAYKTYRCSTGLDPETTPLGTFEISDIYRWRLLVDGSYGQYAMRIHGQIMLHSVPYEQRSPDSLEFWEYNKLGKPASLGCIRLNARNMRWIYRHCPAGTQVEIYSLEHEVPEIPLPKFKKIRATDLYRNWDPTDPNKKNPWKKNKKSR